MSASPAMAIFNESGQPFFFLDFDKGFFLADGFLFADGLFPGVATIQKYKLPRLHNKNPLALAARGF